MSRHTISAATINGTEVTNYQDENLGKIEDVMIDMTTGEVAYLVLSFGGVFGTTMADKRFAVPFNAIHVKKNDGDVCYLLNVSKAQLEDAPGFDKDNYPDFADTSFTSSIDSYYRPYSSTATRHAA